MCEYALNAFIDSFNRVTVFAIVSERMEVADSSQQTDSGSLSPLQSTVIMESGTNEATVQQSESATENDADENREENNITEKIEKLTEDESHSPAALDTGQDSSSVDHDVGQADAEAEADSETVCIQENPTANSAQAAPDRVRLQLIIIIML